MTVQNKRLNIILLSVPLLLLIPLIAMQFTNQVNWLPNDFLVMGILLLITGLSIEFVLRKVKSGRARIVLLTTILGALLLLWAELAVGIFGTPFAGS